MGKPSPGFAAFTSRTGIRCFASLSMTLGQEFLASMGEQLRGVTVAC
jgi:hypothetical protein